MSATVPAWMALLPAASEGLLFWTLMVAGLVVTFFLFLLLVGLCFPRAGNGRQRRPDAGGPRLTQLGMGPVVLFLLGAFLWSSELGKPAAAGAAAPLDVHIVARRWKWRVEHGTGPREINARHVPAGQPVALSIESEDVLHRWTVPALHLQAAAVPGKEGRLLFVPDREGIFPFYCTEFCGPGHAAMRGALYVLDPIAYEHWVTGGKANLPPEVQGKQLFEAFRCESCHLPSGKGTGPALAGRFGGTTELEDGQSQAFDEAYVKESLLDPKAKIAKGYKPVMPSFVGQLDETQIAALVAYLKSTSSGGGQ